MYSSTSRHDAPSHGRLAQQTIARALETLENSPSAHIAQALQIIREISGKSDRITVQQLAEAIGRDPATMTRVIRVANTLGYNPSGSEITTITHAVQLIGFERVRNLTVSLLLLDDAEGKMNAAETRDAAAMAMTSGLIAEELMRLRSGRDPELAFASTAMRNFGRMTMTTFFASDYRQARALAAEIGDDRSFLEVFGIRPLDLARELFTALQLPETLIKSIQPLPARLIDEACLSTQEELILLADFSVNLCEMIDGAEASSTDFMDRVESLASRYGQHLRLPENGMEEMIDTVAENLVNFGKTHGVTNFSSPLIQRVCALAEGKELPPPQKAREWKKAGERPATKSDPLWPGAAQSPSQIIREGTKELANLVRQVPAPLNEVFSIAIQTLVTAIRAKDGLLFVLDGAENTFSARAGVGQVFEHVRNIALLNAGSRDIFGICILRGEDVVIQDPKEARIVSFVPPWLVTATGSNPVQLLPIKDSAGTFAVLCLIGDGKHTLELAAQSGVEVSAMRAHLALLGKAVRSARFPQ